MFELICKHGSEKGEDLIIGTYRYLPTAIVEYMKALNDIGNDYMLRDTDTGDEIDNNEH